ncbi:hypothetical protein HQ585_01495 [candidate division KSB1 bacterium]|nr:hypothetical protein [candidate division KSB1 bacterium]
MKVRFIVILLIIALVISITQCTHLKNFSTLDEVNEAIAGKKATLTLFDKEKIVGKDVQVFPDSTVWSDSKLNKKQSIATSEINHIILRNHLRGALEGLWKGALIPGGIGFVIGLSDGDDTSGFWRMTAGEKALMGFVLFGAPGAVLGSLFGAANGSNNKYIINNEPPPLININYTKEYFLNTWLDTLIVKGAGMASRDLEPDAQKTSVKYYAEMDALSKLRELVFNLHVTEDSTISTITMEDSNLKDQINTYIQGWQNIDTKYHSNGDAEVTCILLTDELKVILKENSNFIRNP